MAADATLATAPTDLPLDVARDNLSIPCPIIVLNIVGPTAVAHIPAMNAFAKPLDIKTVPLSRTKWMAAPTVANDGVGWW